MGKESGLFVLDVDLKGDGPKTLKDKFGKMPETLRAKSGSGGMHYYFSYPTAKDYGDNIRKIGSSLDTKGIGMVVAPPSLHKSGGEYVWENWGTELSDVPPEILNILDKKEDKKPVGEELLITGGDRHISLRTEARALRGRGWKPEVIELAVTMLGEEQCNPPMSGAEGEAEIRDLVKWVGKLPPGRQSTDDVISKMNRKHAVMLGESGKNILTEYINEDGKLDIRFTTAAGLKQDYRNKDKISVWKDEKPKPLSQDQYWLDHPNRREYLGVIFSPTKTTGKFYNLWRGWAVDPQEGDCSLYLNHIREVIADGKEDRYKYILGWMAHAIQQTDRKPGTAIVLRGKQGTGKGQFVQHFGELFGRHFLQVTQQRHITGNFNAHLKDALLVFSDEAFWGGKNDVAGTLKAMVTEEKSLLEFKGKDAYQVNSYIRLIIASNNEWVVPTGAEERRFFTIDISEKYMQNHDYFRKLDIQMRTGGWQALMSYLQNYDLSDFNIFIFPKTKALLSQKLQGLDDIPSFWHERLQSGKQLPKDIEWRDVVVAGDLYDAFKSIFPRSYDGSRGLETAMGKYIKDIFNGKVKKSDRTIRAENDFGKVVTKKAKCYSFPDLKTCQKMYEDYLGQPIEWEEASGAEDFFGSTVTSQINNNPDPSEPVM